MSEPNQPRTIHAVLLLEEDDSKELASVLWAALVEADQFYNSDRKRAEFRRYFVSPFAHKVGAIDFAMRAFGRLMRGPKGMEDALARLSESERRKHSFSSKSTAGRFARTYDQHKLGAAVREMLSIAGDAPLLIITDRDIMPPAHWRYIISDNIENGAVISSPPTDPAYWRERNPHRVSVIKHRVRTAGLGILGGFLDLDECDNNGCFMYSDVDSVTTLDEMTQLGPEHGLQELSGLGFRPISAEPGLIQPIVKGPEPEPEGSVAR